MKHLQLPREVSGRELSDILCNAQYHAPELILHSTFWDRAADQERRQEERRLYEEYRRNNPGFPEPYDLPVQPEKPPIATHKVTGSFSLGHPELFESQFAYGFAGSRKQFTIAFYDVTRDKTYTSIPYRISVEEQRKRNPIKQGLVKLVNALTFRKQRILRRPELREAIQGYLGRVQALCGQQRTV